MIILLTIAVSFITNLLLGQLGLKFGLSLELYLDLNLPISTNSIIWA